MRSLTTLGLIVFTALLACGEPPDDGDGPATPVTIDDVIGIWDAGASSVTESSCADLASYQSAPFKLERQNETSVVVVHCRDAACEDNVRLGGTAFATGNPATVEFRFLQDETYAGLDCALSVDDDPRIYSFTSANGGTLSGSMSLHNYGADCGSIDSVDQALHGCTFKHSGVITKR